MHEGNIKTKERKAGLADEEKEMSSVSVISFKPPRSFRLYYCNFHCSVISEVGLSPARKAFL